MATAPRYRPRFRLRIGEDETPETYCAGCREWWPVTIEYWPTRSSFHECRACANERARLYQVKRRLDPENRLKDLNKSRRYRAYLNNVEPELLSAVETERRSKAMREQAERRTERAGLPRIRNREYMRAQRLAQREAEGRGLYERRSAA